MALSAFDSFCRGAEQGRFPRLEDRDDLWQVLVMITARKVCDLKEHEGRRKRDWRRTVAAGRSPAADESYFPELIGREPEGVTSAKSDRDDLIGFRASGRGDFDTFAGPFADQRARQR